MNESVLEMLVELIWARLKSVCTVQRTLAAVSKWGDYLVMVPLNDCISVQLIT